MEADIRRGREGGGSDGACAQELIVEADSQVFSLDVFLLFNHANLFLCSCCQKTSKDINAHYCQSGY